MKIKEVEVNGKKCLFIKGGRKNIDIYTMKDLSTKIWRSNVVVFNGKVIKNRYKREQDIIWSSYYRDILVWD